MPLSNLLPLKILIVDDDEWSIDFIETVLKSYGFKQIFGISDSRKALEWIKKEHPDLVLLDVVMPHIDGFSLLREIRQLLEPNDYLPVAMMTSEDRQTTQLRALTEGASDFLAKPLEKDEVVLRVCNLLRARWQHLQLQLRNASLDSEMKAQRLLANELEATTARLSALLSNLPSGILVENEDRRVVLANPRFCNMFTMLVPPDDLIGADSSLLTEAGKFTFVDPDRFIDRVNEVLMSREVVVNEELALVDGRTLERDYIPIFNEGKYLGHLWNLRDVTYRKRFELELAEARDHALQSARFKADFLANMSHEIRTPVNGVLGMLGLLADSPLQTEQRSLVKTAQISADALLHIINDVLDFSKIEAGKLLIEDGVFSPTGVLDDCFQTVSATAHDKGLEIMSYVEANVPSGARGDGARVRQILTNFLSNALKFTERGEVVARIQNEDGYLRFSVSDTGIGLSRETAQRLFQPFTQADSSTTRRFGGTGLGLAISRELVERMGGKIGVESTEGQGTTFWFTLPLEAVEISENPEARDLIIALCDARVLVVEDNATIRRYLLQLLDSWQIAGEGARTGTEALHRLRSAARAGRPYDGALLDAQLPDTDAITLAQAIKRERSLSRTHLLLMTALTSYLGTVEPFVATLAKPVRQSQLHDALLQAFQGEIPERVNDATFPDMEHPRFDGVRVLIADDNYINREVAWRWLNKWGCEITSVTNGREVLEALGHQEFDVVLMDCQMPEMDGYEASMAIRQLDNPMRQVTIIAVTAHAMEGDKQKCLSAGMNDYVTKPIRPANFSEVLSRWVRVTAPSITVEPIVASNSLRVETEPEIVLDMNSLIELLLVVGENEFASFIEMFYEQTSESERLMREAIDNDNILALAKSAHTLKGVCRQFGANHVANFCEELENMVKGSTEKPALTSTKIELVMTTMDKLRNALAAARIALHRASTTLSRDSQLSEQESP